ncbi:hypothetical protein [Rhizobium sp. CSW-27]|uniref:hypothetical protein n=1 Tax=Rhizobium sp. CSW-27 TaxID=2839985 RepID=UPI001C01CEF3|nr:hypothetical protein [Rhizobium sp. CSW-27]MBT9373272.1 hypothetical protein [Rhizobium sp. CSW-27]
MQGYFAVENFWRMRALGTDFQSYLGITIILFLIPLYALFGATLFASVLSAHFAVIIGAIALWYAIFRMMRWLRTPTLIVAIAIALPLMDFLSPVLTQPGHSLRPLRWALPYLLFPLVLHCFAKALRSGPFPVCFQLGLFAGAGILWSNDAGLPLLPALLASLLLLFPLNPRALLKALAGVVSGAALSAAALLLLVTHGAPWGWITYNFSAVATDQIWYFGSWGRDTRILAPSDLVYMLDRMPNNCRIALLLMVASLPSAVLNRLRGKGAPVMTSAYVFLALAALGTALLPQIGGHIETGYNDGLLLIGFASPFIVFRARVVRLAVGIRRKVGLPTLARASAITMLVCMTVISYRTWKAIEPLDNKVFQPELGLHVPRDFARDAAAIRSLADQWRAAGLRNDRFMLSVYTSALDIVSQSQSPTPFGSIIHALGEEGRRQFNGMVAQRQVGYVTTIYPGYSPWSQWLYRANWSFFRALNHNYEPVARNGQHVLWRLRASPLPAPAEASAQCSVMQHGDSTDLFVTATGQGGMVSLSIELDPQMARQKRNILTATEISPLFEDRDFEGWGEDSLYGLPPTQSFETVVPAKPGHLSRIRLATLEPAAVPVRACRAELVAWPDLENLPGFEDFVRKQAGVPPRSS